jgi:transposase
VRAEGFLAGMPPKVWRSDRLPAHCIHAEVHQFCLAHLIRDAQYAIDHGDTIFAPQFEAFLKDACAIGDRRDSTIATIGAVSTASCIARSLGMGAKVYADLYSIVATGRLA